MLSFLLPSYSLASVYFILCDHSGCKFFAVVCGNGSGRNDAKEELKAAFGGAMRGLVAESGAGAGVIGGEAMPVCVIPLDGTSILA